MLKSSTKRIWTDFWRSSLDPGLNNTQVIGKICHGVPMRTSETKAVNPVRAPAERSRAGWHLIYSNPDNGISPFDPLAAGGMCSTSPISA
jgi:hypothetical protein